MFGRVFADRREHAQAFRIGQDEAGLGEGGRGGAAVAGHDRSKVGAGEAVGQAAEDGEQAAAGIGQARARQRQRDRGGEVMVLPATLATRGVAVALGVPLA